MQYICSQNSYRNITQQKDYTITQPWEIFQIQYDLGGITGRNKECLFFLCLQILTDSYNFFKKRAVIEVYNFLNCSFMKVEPFAHIICAFIASEWPQDQVCTPWSRENWCFRRNLSPVPRLSRPLPSRYTDRVIVTPNFTYVTRFFCPDIGDFYHMTGSVRVKIGLSVFFFIWRYSPSSGLGLPPWNSPFHLGLLDLRHSAGLFGRVISSSQVYLLVICFLFVSVKGVSEECESYVTSEGSRLNGVIMGRVGFFFCILVCVKVKEMTLNNI
jgi:hypothetical protein